MGRLVCAHTREDENEYQLQLSTGDVYSVTIFGEVTGIVNSFAVILCQVGSGCGARDGKMRLAWELHMYWCSTFAGSDRRER